MKNKLSRRHFLKTSTLAAGAGITLPRIVENVTAVTAKTLADTQNTDVGNGVTLQLLDGKPLALDSGVSFGVPWPQGSMKRNATFNLTAEGKHLPIQTWPMAYWPDGSLKWSGFATVVPAGLASPIKLATGS